MLCYLFHTLTGYKIILGKRCLKPQKRCKKRTPVRCKAFLGVFVCLRLVVFVKEISYINGEIIANFFDNFHVVAAQFVAGDVAYRVWSGTNAARKLALTCACFV